MQNRLAHYIARSVTLFGLVTNISVAKAQNSCPATAFPDSSQYTAAVFVSYEPGRTDEAVLKTYDTILERSPSTKLNVFMTRNDRTSYSRGRTRCQDPRASADWICRLDRVLGDREHVNVIPLEQTLTQVYPQDHLQFFVRDGIPTLMPVAHLEDTLGEFDPRLQSRGIKNTSQIVSNVLGIRLESLGMETRGTEMTMGGNIESLPGNVLVMGDDRLPRLSRSDAEVGRAILELVPPPRRPSLTDKLPQMIAQARVAEATQDALIEYLRSFGAPLLRLDTRLFPVHHADEAFSVVRTNAPCGFSILVPAPALALKILERAPEGDPSACIRSRQRKSSFGDDGARLDRHVRAGCVGFRGETARSILANRRLVQLNFDLAAIMESNKRKIARVLRPVCAKVDFVSLPFLVGEFEGRNEGLFPNPVNALVLTPPRGMSSWLNNPTFVPSFDDVTVTELKTRGVDIRFVRTAAYFEGQGGFHCGTGTLQLCQPPFHR